MAASLSEQLSMLSYPSEGEMVGIGARRKNRFKSQPKAATDEDTEHKYQHKLTWNPASMESGSSTSRNLNQVEVVGNHVRKPRPRKSRRHVYDEIDAVRSEVNNLKVMQTHITLSDPTTPVVKHAYHMNLDKPEVPPKPSGYVLRDKRLRHVYQTIELPCNGSATSQPPPLPEKPFHLKTFEEDDVCPPPLPPRVPNKEAIKQRHKLDVEYFVNLCRNVDDGTLLDLAEEGDLPVQLNPDELANQNANGLVSLNGAAVVEDHVLLSSEQSYPLDPARRYSLPVNDPSLTTDTEHQRNIAPNLPPRALSAESTTQEVCTQQATSFGDDTAAVVLESTQAKIYENLLLLKKCGWYWGNMTWQEAEAILAEKEGEGVFLMRDSQNPLHLLTLTVRSAIDTIHHIRVEYSDGKFQLFEPGHTVSRSAAQCARHSNVEQFIKLAMKHSKSGSFLYFVKPRNMGEPPIQIRLLTPVSRLSKVKSLQYNCRMVIRNLVVPDLISELSIPPKVKKYLLDGPYYDAKEEH